MNQLQLELFIESKPKPQDKSMRIDKQTLKSITKSVNKKLGITKSKSHQQKVFVSAKIVD